MEEHYSDVLVVGAGPTGLMSALLLKRYGVQNVTIIDRDALQTQVGRAAGLQPRTNEILQQLDLIRDLSIAAGGVADTAFWSAKEGEDLKRDYVSAEVTHDTPYKKLIAQHQGRTEELFNRELNKRSVVVKRPFQFLDYEYSKDETYPVTAYIRDMPRGQVDKYHAKYIVAADGAKSVVRSCAKVDTSVNETEDVWLVADCHVESDFPDLRRRCPVRTNKGNLMLIPDDNNGLRIYMLMTQAQDQEDLDASVLEGHSASESSPDSPKKHTTLLDILQRRVPEIIKPYTLTIQKVDWISKYAIAQQVISQFFDNEQRVLFAGDSCHSHSPKAAQGMNTGLQDSYNLCWKLALVLTGRASPKPLLQTYDTERKHIAHQLIEFDEKFAALFGDQSQIGSPEFLKTWKSAQGFTSGLDQEYPSNPALGSANDAKIDSQAAKPLEVGKRFLPMEHLIRSIDGFSIGSLDTMPANGEFYEVLFAGDILSPNRKQKFKDLYTFLTSPSSALTTYNGPAPKDGWPPQAIDFNSDHADNKKVLNLYVVHTSSRLEMELRPAFEQWKWTFFEDQEGREHRRHGIDPEGEMHVALVRPDGIVALVQRAEEHAVLGKAVRGYFEGVGMRKV